MGIEGPAGNSGGGRAEDRLYAPNWEKTSALHKYGERVFEAMKGTEYLFLVKLHYMSLLPKDRVKPGDHVDWRPLLDRYAKEGNIRIIHENNIDPFLSLSDLMVTDYGGAAFEFMCTGKPVVYLDCPEFFDTRGREIMEFWSRESGTSCRTSVSCREPFGLP
jgi:CDP-glycerol glycerophosphotransferase (TagB/SpsB family)